ncbi:MAG: glycosyltransferase [Nitrospirae bacterium]|nr:glycosyltransferase [Nitrospirota bacterium]
MKPLEILHILPGLWVGGVQSQLLTVLGNYDRSRFYPIVCSLSGIGTIGRKMEDMGVEVHCLNKLGNRLDLTIIQDLYRLMKKREIKIVRTHQYHANLYGRIAANLAGVPCIVVSIHNIYNRDRKIHRRMINRFLAGLTDKIIAVSETVGRDIIKYDSIPKNKIMVIYNGIETNRFLHMSNGSAVRTEFKIPSSVSVIGIVGRLVHQKGHKYLLEAMVRIKARFPGSMLLIVGDGPLKGELTAYARDRGLGKDVIFAGSRMDIPDLLSAMDIFVFPSFREGLGNALLEAMAAGKPIIATDVAPMREIINSEEVGILVPPKDSNALASAIEVLMSDRVRAEALGGAARRRALSFFDIKNTIDNYTGLFEDIMRRKGMAV